MQKPLAALALAAASVVVLSGCSMTTGAADDGKVHIVASTNIYGSLAAQVGGDRVDVTSLIDSAAKDPHSYEATARDRLAVQQADLVIANGGGYDSFMDQLVDGSDAALLTAVEFSHDYPDATVEDDEHSDHAEEDAHAEDDHEGHSHIEGFNEHVWFDPHTVTHVVEHIAEDLAKIDPDGADEFTANAEKLNAEIEQLETELDGLHTRLEGTPVFITEPLPGYLAAAAGLDDATPEGFALAVEEGNDVAPATLLASLDLIKGKGVAAVLANAQTGGSETTQIEDAAKQAGIPIITFSELLEADQSYAEWMRAAINDLAAALDE